MASRSTEAMVDARILKWARETAGLTPEAAARSLQAKNEKVLAWERGEERPSMPQLRKMAIVYKRQPAAVEDDGDPSRLK
jgi:DNA-binding transcriptional regulator YiaG